jgi:hypothetical protein
MIPEKRTPISRILIAASQMPAPQARAVLALICANGLPDPNLRKSAQSADEKWQKYYAKRKPAIARLHSDLKAELRLAQADSIRNLRKSSVAASLCEAQPTAIHAAGASAAILFNPADLDAGLRAILSNTFAEVLQEAGNDFFEELQLDDVFTMPPQAAKDFIANRQNLMTDVSQEVFDSIKAELDKGIDKGESLRKIERRITDKFGEMAEGRAKTVASTEVAAAYGFARNKALIESGATRKQWLTSRLPNVRPAHRAAEGQVVPANKPFRVGGEDLMYPSDQNGSPGNTVNCHCISIPVMEGKNRRMAAAKETESSS